MKGCSQMAKNWTPGVFYGLADGPTFGDGLKRLALGLPAEGSFMGDNLITFSKGLGFLDDKPLMASIGRHVSSAQEASLLWRISVVLWGVRTGLRLKGDFVECACYKGTTVRVICDAVDFARYAPRRYWLYDLFEHDLDLPHHAMPEHSQFLFMKTKERFADTPNVLVTQGRVPDVLKDVSPQSIAFMHLDLNNVDAEMGALEILFDRMEPGAVLVLDDFGWAGYAPQRVAETGFFKNRGYNVLELPTGQGIVIKH